MNNSRVIFWVAIAAVAYIVYRHLQVKTQDFTLSADGATIPNMAIANTASRSA